MAVEPFVDMPTPPFMEDEELQQWMLAISQATKALLEQHVIAIGEVETTTASEHDADGNHTKDNVGGWHGDQDRIKILPSDFTTADLNNPEQIASDGSDVTLAGPATAIMATVPIPIGYKATAVRVYAAASKNIVVFENAINDNSVTSKGTGNTTAEIDITDVTASDLNYISIRVADVNSVVIYGGYVTIARV